MRHTLRFALLGATLLTASPALAQSIETASLIKRTCASHPDRVATRGRLAHFILSDQGIVVSPGAAERRLSAIATWDERKRHRKLNDSELAMRDIVYQLQGELGEGGTPAEELGLGAAQRRPGRTEAWLFNTPVVLTCYYPDEAQAAAQKSKESPLRLRATVDDLALNGDERKTAGSANIGYLRERSTADDGTVSVSTTTSFKGVLGYQITPTAEERGLVLFAGYELKRVRTDPPPTLAPGKTERDSDTDIFKVGMTGYTVLGKGFFLEANGSVLFDRVQHSERIRGEASLELPVSFLDNGLCAFGMFTDPLNSWIPGVRGRCGVTALWQVSHFTRLGTATPGATDELVLGGGKFTFDLATTDDSGVIAGLSYEYQKTLSGSVPSIDRFNAYLKYRHWIDPTFGVDFGFEFTDGINPDTFADENKLQFSVGLIF